MPDARRWLRHEISLLLGLTMSGLVGGAVSEAAAPAAPEAAQSGPAAAPPELVTDRPDFTDSTVVVPRGRLQLESGFNSEWGSDGRRQLDAPEVLLRWG